MAARIIDSRVEVAFRKTEQRDAIRALPDYSIDPVDVAALAASTGRVALESYLRKMARHAATIGAATTHHYQPVTALPRRLELVQSGAFGHRAFPIAMCPGSESIRHLINAEGDIDAQNRPRHAFNYPFFSPTADAAVGMAKLGAWMRGLRLESDFDPDRTYVIGPGSIGTATAERLTRLMGGTPHVLGSGTSAEVIPQLHKRADLVLAAVGIGVPLIQPTDVLRRPSDGTQHQAGIVAVDIAVSEAPNGSMIGDFHPSFYDNDPLLDEILISARSGPRMPSDPRDRSLGVGPWANGNLFHNAIDAAYMQERLALPRMLGNFSLATSELIAAA